LAHEILKLKPVTNPGLNIDCPACQASLSFIPSLLALNSSSVEGGKRGTFVFGEKEKLPDTVL